MWLYEHTTKWVDDNEKNVPRICSWANLYQGKNYDAVKMLSSMKDKEVCDVVFVLCFWP